MDYSKMLFDRFGTALLTTKQVSTVTGRSVASLEADRRHGTGVEFKRVGGKDNSPVRYPLHSVSKFLNSVEQIA